MAPQDWIKQTLTELRKRDRSGQRTHLQNVLNTRNLEECAALRHEIEARSSRVQQELRTYQGHAHPDATRKAAQKEAMIARYNWLLKVIDQHVSLPAQQDVNME